MGFLIESDFTAFKKAFDGAQERKFMETPDGAKLPLRSISYKTCSSLPYGGSDF
jgi:hypothetical protein